MKIFLSSLLVFFSLVSPIFAHEGTHDVSLTDDGFVPNKLTIEVGETVRFENVGARPHWPASDLHPAHEIYPAFDPKRGIQSGESWEFTFDKPGTWNMHDHLEPEWIGTITVTGEAAVTPTPTPTNRISNFIEEMKLTAVLLIDRLLPNRLSAELLKTNMHEAASDEEKSIYWLKRIGEKKTMEELVSDSGGGSIVDCHQEAHRLGRLAYGIYGSEVFRTGNASCHSGFYHGAMEALLTERGTQNLNETVQSVCTNFTTSFGTFECLHGIGHGVMAVASYDMPKALETCRQLEGTYAQSSCYGGVFMENIIAAEGQGAIAAHETKWVSDDPHFPCNAVEEDESIQVQCYLMQTSRMLDLSGHDFSFVRSECMKAPDDMKTICFQSMGRDAAGQTLRDPDKTLALCKSVPDEYYMNCVTGALHVVIEFWGETLEDQASIFCGRLDDGDNKAACFGILGTRLRDVFGDDIQTIGRHCSYAQPAYVSNCTTAANIKI